TPLLVRCLKVFKALHWLKLNHVDYYDCEISGKNLASYPEAGSPVVVDYHPSSSNQNPESTIVHDMEEEDGTTEGPCPFTWGSGPLLRMAEYSSARATGLILAERTKVKN